MPRDGIVAGVIVRVGAQTGYDLDDVAVQTDASNYALFQVKAGMKLGATVGSPLSEALGQAVAQYLDGRLSCADGTDRAVDPLRDALVLCTDSSAPATVRVDLAKALDRTGLQPPGTPLEDGLTVKQHAALNVVLTHVRRLWVQFGRTDPDDEQLRGFLRALHVVSVDANHGEPDAEAAVAMLATVLPDGQSARRAWPLLVAEGQAAAVERQWRDRAALGIALSRQDLRLSPPFRYTKDVTTLRDLSAANLRTLQAEAVLPVPGGLFIRRTVSARLAADSSGDNLLIVGDAGVGKSAVAQEFATNRSASQDVIVLRAADVAGANHISLDAPLSTVMRAWEGSPGVVLVDGVDALRGAEDREFLSGFVVDLRGSRWQVVATVRTFDARNNRLLQAAFPGDPLSEDVVHMDRRLSGVRHVVVGDLTEGELDAAVTELLPLTALLAEAPDDLRALLRNPFNLRLTVQLMPHLSEGGRHDLLAVRSRTELLEAYWTWRVQNENTAGRTALLTRLVQRMTEDRSLRVVEAEPVITAADGPALEAMLSENVLSADGLIPTARRVVMFSHNILFDYAVAVYLLLDPVAPSRLLTVLDADPSLPLVARPSLEMLVDLLWWHRDDGSPDGLFWPLCLAVAASPHVLASLAFAARLLNVVVEADDLAVLALEPGRADQVGEAAPAQQFIRQIVGAYRTPAVLASPARAVVPLAALARRLAEHLPASYSDGGHAADLLIALQRRAPLQPGEPGSQDRSSAIAGLLDGCRVDPQRLEPLADAAARQLPHAIAVGSEARNAVGRLLDDEPALRQWGGTVLTWLAEAVIPAATHDPELARRMAAMVFGFEETRDEQVMFGGSSALFALNESRRQQAEHGAYRLGESFAELCAADLHLAAEIFCDLAESGWSSDTDEQWPLTMPGVTGRLRYGRSLSLGPRRAGLKAAAALAASLATADADAAQPVVALLVERLHNADAWDSLMARGETIEDGTTGNEPAHGDDAVALGRVLLPALTSGALLAHPVTHAAAAGLLAALAEHDPALAPTLEAAVLQAHTLADSNDGSQWLKDTLIGCLPRHTIISTALTDRLDELGPDGPPALMPRTQLTATVRPWSIMDDLAQQGVELPPAVETAARALHRELGLVRNGLDTRPEAERRLPELFAEADTAFAATNALHPRVQTLLVEAAAALTHDRRLLPGTVLGERVLAVLETAASSLDAGSLLS